MLSKLESNPASTFMNLTTKENVHPSTSTMPDEQEDYSEQNSQLKVIDDFLKQIDSNYCFILNQSEPDKSNIVKIGHYQEVIYNNRDQSIETPNSTIETKDIIKIWKCALKSLVKNRGNENEILIDAIVEKLIPCLTTKFIDITTSASCLKTSFKDIYSICKMADYQVHIKHGACK